MKDAPKLSEINVLVSAKIGMRDLTAEIKIYLGETVANVCNSAMHILLQWAADHGYNGDDIYIGLPEDLRREKQVIMDAVGQYAKPGSYQWETADGLCNQLIHEGYEHGKKVRQFENLRRI